MTIAQNKKATATATATKKLNAKQKHEAKKALAIASVVVDSRTPQDIAAGVTDLTPTLVLMKDDPAFGAVVDKAYTLTVAHYAVQRALFRMCGTPVVELSEAREGKNTRAYIVALACNAVATTPAMRLSLWQQSVNLSGVVLAKGSEKGTQGVINEALEKTGSIVKLDDSGNAVLVKKVTSYMQGKHQFILNDSTTSNTACKANALKACTWLGNAGNAETLVNAMNGRVIELGMLNPTLATVASVQEQALALAKRLA